MSDHQANFDSINKRMAEAIAGLILAPFVPPTLEDMVKMVTPIIDIVIGPDWQDHVEITPVQNVSQVDYYFRPLTELGCDMLRKLFPDCPPPMKYIEFTIHIEDNK